MKNFLLFFILLLFALPIFAENKIDINSATLSQLDEIIGIGPKYAQAIIDARPFSSVDDLTKVKGIGPKTLEKIKQQGFACVNCEAKQAETRPPEPAAAGETSSSSGEVGPPIAYPSGIFITEILPNPEGADEENEYIKLFNSNDFEVDLNGWKLQNTAGTITTYTISQKFLANNYLILKRPETKITLHNDGDGVKLLSPDNQVKDSIIFQKAPLGQILSKENNFQAMSKKVVSTKTDLPKQEKNDSNIVEDLTANLSLPAEKNNSPWILFFAALAITIISAVAVLLIKVKLQKNVRT